MNRAVEQRSIAQRSCSCHRLNAAATYFLAAGPLSNELIKISHFISGIMSEYQFSKTLLYLPNNRQTLILFKAPFEAIMASTNSKKPIFVTQTPRRKTNSHPLGRASCHSCTFTQSTSHQTENAYKSLPPAQLMHKPSNQIYIRSGACHVITLA